MLFMILASVVPPFFIYVYTSARWERAIKRGLRPEFHFAPTEIWTAIVLVLLAVLITILRPPPSSFFHLSVLMIIPVVVFGMGIGKVWHVTAELKLRRYGVVYLITGVASCIIFTFPISILEHHRFVFSHFKGLPSSR